MLTIPGKIPIQIYPLFYVMVFAISMINSNFQVFGAILWAFVIFFSLIVHELGHALTAIACGQRASIDLVGFGGITRRHGPPLKPLQEFIIVLNGPLAGFILGTLSYYTYLSFGPSLPIVGQEILQISAFANFFWTVLNLLPVQPLDGGHLLRITLEGFFGLRGLKSALFLSFLSSLGLSIAFFILHMSLIGAFFLMFTFESYRAWKASLVMTSQDNNKSLQQFFKNAEKDFHKGHLSYAQEKLNVVRKEAQKGVLYTSATLLLARILHAQGHHEEAYQRLQECRKDLPPDLQALLHKLAYLGQHWQEGIEIGNRLYQYQPNYDVALVNALCHAQLKQTHPAIGWLQCAIKNGLYQVQEALDKGDFDAIRHEPEFQEFYNMHLERS